MNILGILARTGTMAIRVRLSELTPEHKRRILEDLFLTPTISDFAKKNLTSVPSETLSFFTKNDEYVALPYYYGIYVLRPPIHWPKYPPASWEMSPTFTYRSDKCDQKAAVKEAFSHLLSHRTANLHLFPGAGKTVISACLASTLKVKTLVIFCFTTLKNQWSETFTKFTTAKTVIFDGKNSAECAEADVIISMYGVVEKLGPILDTIGCLIVDEAHRMCTRDKVEALLATQPGYVITCTATLERNNGMERMMHLMSGTHATKVRSSKTFTVVRVDTGLRYTMEFTTGPKRRVDWSNTLNKICYDPTRIVLITNFLIQLCLTGRRIIAVCERKETLDQIQSRLENYVTTYPQYASQINWDSLYDGKNRCEERTLLLGTISKIGTAYDEALSYTKFSGKSASVLVIMSSFKDQKLLEQVVGRIRDRSSQPVIYDLVDNNPTCRKHWHNPDGKTEKERGRFDWYTRNGATMSTYSFPKRGDFPGLAG